MSLRPHLEVRERPIGLFKPNDRNPRYITDERFDALVSSMREFPWLSRARPIVARPDGRVIAGNMRLRASQALGLDKVWAVVVGDEIPDENVERLVALVDNGDYGEWDDQLVAEWLYELDEAGVDLELTGFADADVKKLLASVAGPEPEPREPTGHVDYECPNCGHGWSGHPRPKEQKDG